MLVALVRRNCAAATPCSRALKSALFHSSAPSCLASKRQPGGGGGGGGGSQQSIQRLSPNPPPRAQQKPSSSKSSSSSPSPSSSTKNPWLDSLESLVKLVRVFVESETLHKRCKTLRLSPALVEETKESFIGAVAQGNLISHQDLAVRFKSGEDIERILLAEFFNHAADVSKMMAETEVASNSSSSSSTATSDILTILTDSSSLKNPAAWFKETRLMKRKIIMHVGPTNSGKTYNALQSLGTAASGIYCGPLRLLAHEIYERFNASGVRCNLITGEDRREMEGVDLYACTVEMALLHKQFDVAVIDEIQMISDSSRGWAWTQAFLGLKAKEIHICGEPTTIDLIKRICASVGEEVEVREYKRLTNLEVEQTSLDGDLTQIKKGDCLITFSRKNIFMMKRKVEAETGLKCAVVYGALPPETRSEQARLFNDPDSKYSVLVASDAVGMGLNLNIGRIVFERVEKYDGEIVQDLTTSQVKQIGGRAGRFGTVHSTGKVTTVDAEDLDHVKTHMALTAPVITHAGIAPTYEILERFAKELPNERLSSLLDKFEDLARTGGDYFLCNLKNQKRIANLIHPIRGLSLMDRHVFMVSPCKVSDGVTDLIQISMYKFAKSKANKHICHISEVVRLPKSPPIEETALKDMEMKHSIVMLYLWLSYRFPETFSDVATALSLKNTCEEYINHALLHLKFERIRKTNSRPDYRSYKNSGGASSWRSEIKSSGLLQQQHHHHHKSSAMNHENRGRGEFRDGRLSSFKAEKDQFLEETASDEQMVTSSATIRKIRY